ncbi:MAG: tRNA lysidine(34) synthetase TilS [Pseudomonadota bacterium]
MHLTAPAPDPLANGALSTNLFEHLPETGSLAVAVSGGSDSLALLYLLAAWAEHRATTLFCITVDHGLRKAAIEEAAYVKLVCDGLGISHTVLTWKGEKPVSGLSEAARKARYQLMAAFCTRYHIDDLVLGHQQDDQVETVLMRLARSKGDSRGLSGMAARSCFRRPSDDDLILHRPLLDVPREKLRDYLRRCQVSWMDDPTNDDQRYERVRRRHVLRSKPALGRDVVHYADLMRRYRRVLAWNAATFIRAHVERTPFAAVMINRRALQYEPRPVAILVLQALLSVVGGRDHLPSNGRVEALLSLKGATTLARVLVQPGDDTLTLTREVRNLPGVVPLSQTPIKWDGRYWITAFGTSGEVVCGQELTAAERMYLQTGDCAPSGAMDKKAFASLPFLRIGSGPECRIEALWTASNLQMPTMIMPVLGSFDTYSPDCDEPLRDVLQNLFTKPVHFDDT